MKQFFSLACLFCLYVPCFAQSNSVWLMDNNGIILGTYNSITQAYAAIPATITNGYEISLLSNYNGSSETLPITFVNKPGASSTNKIRLTSNAMFPSLDADTTDVFVFDDADWIEFDLYFLSWKNSPGRHVFYFKNGACNNLIRGLEVHYGIRTTYGPDAEPHILFGTSPNNPDGNSNNRIEHCAITTTNGILSAGTAANPNQNNVIKNNFFRSDCKAITTGTGTSGIIIDSNNFQFVSVRRHTKSAIDLENISGNISLTRNTISFFQDSGRMAAIYVSTDGPNQCLIANNMISTTEWIIRTARSLQVNSDESDNLSGIWLDGNNPILANIYHNTILIKGAYAAFNPGAVQSVASNCLLRTENNAASIYDIRNNLFINTRAGGKSQSHVALNLSLQGSVTTDYNIYDSKTGIAILNGNPYNTLAAYKAEAIKTNNNDIHSDSITIKFAGHEGMHLHNSMYGNTALYGTNISVVPADIENNTRSVYYRGADEYTIACPNSLTRGWASVREMDSCQGHYSEFYFYNTAPAKDGVTYQWQIRHAGGPDPFVDFPGEQDQTFYALNMGTMDYRVKTTCVGTGYEVYSDTITMYAKQMTLPTVDSIIAEKGPGWDYTFIAVGATNTTTFLWDFDDPGGVVSNDTVKHNFKFAGQHRVRLIVTNKYCGYDTAYVTVEVGLGLKDKTGQGAIRVYPNPASDYLLADVPEYSSYTITDLSGRIIMTGNISASGIDIRQLLPGNYIISSTLKEQKVYTRFLKE